MQSKLQISDRNPQANGVWQVLLERKASWWRYYRFVAIASEGGHEYRLDCHWERPVYLIEVTREDLGPSSPLFIRLLFADANCAKCVRQVMRIARKDVARQLERLDRLHRYGVIGAGQVCRGTPSTGT